MKQRRAAKRTPKKRSRAAEQSLGGIAYEDLVDSESLPQPISDQELESDDESSLDIGIKVVLSFDLWKVQGSFPQFWDKAPGQNWEKMIDLTVKLGEINDNKGSKIYPPNQVVLDCIMPSIPLKHKCLSIILIWVIVSHK